MTKPTAIDGSDGPLVVRRIVAWRRLEPGDVRTPGTEIAPESPHLEAKILEVGIAEALLEELERLEAKRAEVTAAASGWLTRYEPGGVLFATGGALAVGAWLDYLPEYVLPFAGSLVVLGIAVGTMTRAFKLRRDKAAEKSWRATKERDELAKIERRLEGRWERFATRLREETGFRTDVRVGDIHEADRLVSIDPKRIAHPDTWRPDPKPNDVRYGWMYADGRVVEQKAELEDTAEDEAEVEGYASAARDEAVRASRDGGADGDDADREGADDADREGADDGADGDEGDEAADREEAELEHDAERDDDERPASKARGAR